eukprot:TRINITY_DN588_c0_g1_i1.p1 TRINITY_DN588_c0_g1~~TRINITY_DN588_c0_g1_i1.p1  ORF type:complete len:431 (-),score=106.67 TRINITY_DN588_c0_g1_i1:198-1490(-)
MAPAFIAAAPLAHSHALRAPLSSRRAFFGAAAPVPRRVRADASASARARAAPRAAAVTTDNWVKAPGAERSSHHADAKIAANVSQVMARKNISRPVIIGVAADSGCGKSTFLRRVTSIFGTNVSKAHTPVGDFISVICLDDYHTHDRKGRREAKVTALDERANNFDLMASQLAALKQGKSIMKPIYNHETGEIDAPELVEPNHVIVIEGLHPMYDARVRELLDFTVYLDLADEVKIAWKIQRDMAERGHTLENILASIESRKPDFERFVDPQKKNCDVVMEILPTQLIPDDTERKVLRVRLLQDENHKLLDPVFLYDEGSTIDWVPCGRKLTCSYPGIKFHYGPDTYYDKAVSVFEVDGGFEKLEEMVYVETHIERAGTKFFGEITQSLLRNPTAPGSTNGTGLVQVLMAMMMRNVYEKITGRSVAVSSS